MLYYEMPFPLTIIFKHNFEKILLLMFFSMSLKTPNIFWKKITGVWKKWLELEKRLYGLFLWMEFNCLKASAISTEILHKMKKF